MPTVYISSVINAPRDAVWNLIRDFNAMPSWHPLITRSVIENDLPSDQIGCIRNFDLSDGTNLREKLLTLSDKDYVFAYKIEGVALGLSNYVAELTLHPVTNGNKCFGVWTATFDCEPGLEDEKVAVVGQGVFQGGFDAMEITFGDCNKQSSEVLEGSHDKDRTVIFQFPSIQDAKSWYKSE